MPFIKVIQICLGTVSLIIGVIGVFVPGLPTTPFLLISSVLYIKSSDKLYRKLTGNRFIGSYIIEYRENKGMTRKTKLSAIGTMWGMISLSGIFFITSFSIKLIILAIGITGTFIMGFVIPTANISKR